MPLRSRRERFAYFGCVAVGSLAAAGCGGSNSGSFVAQANDICTHTAKPLVAILHTRGAKTRAQLSTFVDRASALLARLVHQIGAKRPPTALRGKVTAMLASFQAMRGPLRTLRDALHGKPVDVYGAQTTLDASQQTAEQLAFGLKLF